MKQARSLDEMSTVELLDHLYAELRKLKNLVRTRRGRERALELVTEIFLVFNAIAKRVAGMSFSEGPVAVEDEDEQGEERGMPLAELFHGPDEDDHFSEEETDDIDELRRIIRELKMTRLERYKSIMAYLTKDCRNEIDISKRVVAINRASVRTWCGNLDSRNRRWAASLPRRGRR